MILYDITKKELEQIKKMIKNLKILNEQAGWETNRQNMFLKKLEEAQIIGKNFILDLNKDMSKSLIIQIYDYNLFNHIIGFIKLPNIENKTIGSKLLKAHYKNYKEKVYE